MEQDKLSSTSADRNDLSMTMAKWKWSLIFIGVALIGAYFGYFGWYGGLPQADTPDRWGTFGDFVGGIMNPIVAFAAFYWLTQSVKLQKQELADTRKELAEQAKNGRKSVHLDALTAMVNANYSRLNSLMVRLKDAESFVTDDEAHPSVRAHVANRKKEELKVEIRRVEAELDEHVLALRSLLSKSSDGA